MNEINLLIALALNALWVTSWLHWLFYGDIRHFLFAYVFPKTWRAGREPSDITMLTIDDFENFLAAESDAPEFVRGLLGCPGCVSAHLSLVGTAAAVMALDFSWWALPLVWAGGAWIGHRLHHRV